MYRPTYLLRFDDLCPTMNWPIWQQIEAILIAAEIKPIIAVIPDNQDRSMCITPPVSDFWPRVRAWQQRGWTIALHGYQHTYVNRNGGLLNITPQSEFAGVPPTEQERRIQAGVHIFQQEGLEPRVWVAPSHSFDHVTLELLRQAGIRVISDGMTRFPYQAADGLVWAPVQIWRFKPVPPGVWTICLHPNTWGDAELAQFRDNVATYRPMIGSLDDVLRQYAGRQWGLCDGVSTCLLRGRLGVLRLRHLLTDWYRRLPDVE